MKRNIWYPLAEPPEDDDYLFEQEERRGSPFGFCPDYEYNAADNEIAADSCSEPTAE